MTDLVLPPLQQWLLLFGVVVALGCVAWRGVVGPRASRLIAPTEMKELRRIERDVAGVGALAALALIGVWALRMGVQVMMFRDPFVPLWEDVSFLLFETFWGTVWMAQGAILPLLAASFWVARGRGDDDRQAAESGALARSPRARSAWHAASALALLLVATLALSSHAMGVETARPLIVMADGVHALVAGSWIGSLGLILTVGRPAGRPGDSRVFAAQLRSFSPMAVTSVFMLLAVGVVLAWTHLHTVTNLWTTSYGRILSAKIGAACTVFAMGFWNWQKGLPATDTAEGQAAVGRLAAWEVSFAGGVLLLTAILVNTAKP